MIKNTNNTKNNQVKAIELLAPAKNFSQGKTAILHGADAVYIGGPSFGARSAVGNSIEDIKALCDFAHLFYAKVYVAFNTILKDDEIAKAQNLIQEIYEAGADALIVQDMGILQLDLPPIALHASTQCDIRSLDKVLFLESLGFSQVVLARELDLKQIQEISQHTQLEIEAFIHGALCVSYSGQCYISHDVTGRSANRGECSQMCRLPATLTDKSGKVLAKDQHLLSLKDMNQSDNLELLLKAGVTSFKIEGRLKDEHYVKNVTAWYRQKLDELIEQNPKIVAASHGRCQYSFKPDPLLSFNRGSTDYFIHGRKRISNGKNQGKVDITEFRSPKPIGTDAGKIVQIGKNYIEVSSSLIFANGDGLSYFDKQGQLQGLRINRSDGNKLFPAKMPSDLKPKMRLYRNHHQDFASQLSKDTATRNIAINMHFYETDSGFALLLREALTSERTKPVVTELLCDKQEASSAEQSLDNIEKNLKKLGNTIFEAQAVTLEFSKPWFIPVGQLKQLRRKAIDALLAQRAKNYTRPKRLEASKAPMLLDKKRLNFSANVLNQQAQEFYAKHGVVRIEPAFEHKRPEKAVPLMLTKHCLRYSFNLCPKEVEGIKAEPMQLELGGHEYTLRFDCKNCEMHVMG